MYNLVFLVTCCFVCSNTVIICKLYMKKYMSVGTCVCLLERESWHFILLPPCFPLGNMFETPLRGFLIVSIDDTV